MADAPAERRIIIGVALTWIQRRARKLGVMRYGIAILALLTAGFGRAPDDAFAADRGAFLRGDAPRAVPVTWRYSQSAGWVECDAVRARAQQTRYAIPAQAPYAFHNGLLIVRDAGSGEIVFAHDLHGQICAVKTRPADPVRFAAR